MSCAQLLSGAVWLVGAAWAVAVFPALLCTKEFHKELPVEGQGRRKVLRVLEQSFGNLPAGTSPFLSLSMSKHFSKGISTPGIPHQKYPLNNVSLVPDSNDVGVLVHFYSVNTPLSWQWKLVFWSSVSGKTDGPATSVLYLSGPFTQGHNTSPVAEKCLDTVLQHS